MTNPIKFWNAWGTFEIGETLHVIPISDLRDHDGENCWCNPFEDEDGVLVHNAADERESYAYGRQPS